MTWRAGWYVDSAPRSYIVQSSGGSAIAAGKYYWEVTITSGGADGTSGFGIHCGVCTSALALTGTVATAVNIAQGAHGAFISWRANNPTEDCIGWGDPTRIPGIISGEPLVNDEVIAFCLDTINHKLWFKNVTRDVPTGTWAGGADPAGDPATNTFGADLAALSLTGNLYIFVGASHGSGSAKGSGTVNFGASAFTITPPAGFTSINSVAGATVATLNPSDNSNLILSNGNLSFAGDNVPVTFSPAIGGFTTNVGYSSSVRSRFAIAQA